jgi:hypothetical protein
LAANFALRKRTTNADHAVTGDPGSRCLMIEDATTGIEYDGAASDQASFATRSARTIATNSSSFSSTSNTHLLRQDHRST